MHLHAARDNAERFSEIAKEVELFPRKVASALNPDPDRQRRRAEQVARAHAKQVIFSLRSAPVTRTGFRGKYEEGRLKAFGFKPLLKDGFVYFPWCGRYVVCIISACHD